MVVGTSNNCTIINSSSSKDNCTIGLVGFQKGVVVVVVVLDLVLDNDDDDDDDSDMDV